MGAYELPRIWFADDDKNGDGKSWANAYKYLQDALNYKDALNNNIKDGNEICVADGTYWPDECTDHPEWDNYRTKTFQLLEDVPLYGGFAGTEAGLCQRKWRDNKTTLNGDIDKDQILDSDNSYHVVTDADRAVLNGFTIMGGNADESAYSTGGGMFSTSDCEYPLHYHCSTIANCIFQDNKANWGGGGIALDTCSIPKITNCVFVNNHAQLYGGACLVINTPYAAPVLTNCVFYENHTDTSGGGMALVDAEAILINCVFNQNTADYCGAVTVEDKSWLRAKNCIFWGDTGTINTNEIGGPLCCIDVEYSCIDDGYPDDESIPFGGSANHNIDADPDFPIDEPGYEFGPEGEDGIWATEDDGLMPGPKSPCINAADFWLPGPRIDTTSRVRTNISPYPDMGAYESKYKIMLVMCFIDETHSQGYYYNLNEYRADRDDFYDLLAGLPYANDPKNFSLLKAGCIVPPYVATGFEGNIADVLPKGFFDPEEPPQILPAEDEPVGISIAECDRPPTGDELIDHFHRIREDVGPDCIIRLADSSSSLGGFGGLGQGYTDFKNWLSEWLKDYGLDPEDTDVLPTGKPFANEQWIEAIRYWVDDVINP